MYPWIHQKIEFSDFWMDDLKTVKFSGTMSTSDDTFTSPEHEVVDSVCNALGLSIGHKQSIASYMRLLHETYPEGSRDDIVILAIDHAKNIAKSMK